jgi:hypothetical protein
MTLSARVRNLDLQRMRAELLADPEEVLDRRRWEKPPIDDSFLKVLSTDEKALHGRAQQEQEPKVDANWFGCQCHHSAFQVRKFPRRNIDHPLFKNVDGEAAERHLKDLPVGEVVIRPSARGLHHLTITWKCSDEVYVHLGVLEKDKPNDVSSALGRTLIIGDEKFDDLDEILERFVFV